MRTEKQSNLKLLVRISDIVICLALSLPQHWSQEVYSTCLWEPNTGDGTTYSCKDPLCQQFFGRWAACYKDESFQQILNPFGVVEDQCCYRKQLVSDFLKKCIYEIKHSNCHTIAVDPFIVDTSTVPDPPTSLQFTLIGTAVQLTWVAPANTGGLPILVYQVQRHCQLASQHCATLPCLSITVSVSRCFR
jgi:hypothetical protein